METAKVILRKYFDPDNSVDENAIIRAMKEYSTEVSKETLKNVANKSQDMYYYKDEPQEDIFGDLVLRKSYPCYGVPKQTILNDNNIPDLL